MVPNKKKMQKFLQSLAQAELSCIAKLSQAQTEASVLAEISFSFVFTPRENNET